MWHRGRLSVSSDMARTHSVEVAYAASLGLITSAVQGQPARFWIITQAGVLLAEKLDGRYQ